MGEPIEPIVKKVRALMALINSRAESPTEEALIEFELRWAQMPDMRVYADQHGGVTFVVGDFDDLRAVGILKT